MPPLTVGNNKTLVPHLNANYLDGLSATKLQRRIASTCAVGAVASVSSTGAVVCRSFAGIPTTFGAGTNAYKVPAGVHKVEVRLWGGGGSGGDGDGYASGGGGGQGGMVDALVDVSPGDVLSFDVGAGGVLTYAGYAASGVQGADSTVGYAAGGTGTPAQILIAHGGSGGTSSFNGCDTETADGGTATAAQPALGLVEAEGASGGAGSCGSGAGIAGGAADSAGGGGQGGDFAPQSSDPNGHGRPGADGLAMVTPESS
ncbi:MAG TPA: hypothetical protein VHV79_03295 [Mycobacteriales bacterium]|nr:hypothetical protein [Mycobacteriales bacterium]